MAVTYALTTIQRLYTILSRTIYTVDSTQQHTYVPFGDGSDTIDDRRLKIRLHHQRRRQLDDCV